MEDGACFEETDMSSYQWETLLYVPVADPEDCKKWLLPTYLRVPDQVCSRIYFPVSRPLLSCSDCCSCWIILPYLSTRSIIYVSKHYFRISCYILCSTVGVDDWGWCPHYEYVCVLLVVSVVPGVSMATSCQWTLDTWQWLVTAQANRRSMLNCKYFLLVTPTIVCPVSQLYCTHWPPSLTNWFLAKNSWTF